MMTDDRTRWMHVRPINELRFTIPGRLPNLNDYTAANRKHPRAGAKMKKDAGAFIAPYLPRPVATLRYPVTVTIAWHEPDRRRDPDNVQFAVKFILDALTHATVLAGDSQRYIRGIVHDGPHDPDPRNPRIEVTIEGSE